MEEGPYGWGWGWGAGMGLNLILTATRATEGQEGLEGEMHVTVHIIRAVKQETPPHPPAGRRSSHGSSRPRQTPGRMSVNAGSSGSFSWVLVRHRPGFTAVRRTAPPRMKFTPPASTKEQGYRPGGGA